MLQQVETSADAPITTDNTVKTRAEMRFSAQAYCVPFSELQEQGAAGGPTSSQKFRVRGMEAAVRGVRATSSSKVPQERAKPCCRQRSRVAADGPSARERTENL